MGAEVPLDAEVVLAQLKDLGKLNLGQTGLVLGSDREADWQLLPHLRVAKTPTKIPGIEIWRARVLGTMPEEKRTGKVGLIDRSRIHSVVRVSREPCLPSLRAAESTSSVRNI